MGEVLTSQCASKKPSRPNPAARTGKNQNAAALARRYRRIAAACAAGGFGIRMLLFGGLALGFQAGRLCRMRAAGCSAPDYARSLALLLRGVFR